MTVAGVAVQIVHRHHTGSAGLVDHRRREFDELVLLHDLLQQARGFVVAAALLFAAQAAAQPHFGRSLRELLRLRGFPALTVIETLGAQADVVAVPGALEIPTAAAIALDAAAKAGMHGFTKSLALEVARKGVTVNTISPGYIGTKMVMEIPQEVLDSKIIPQIPMARLGKP